MAKLQPTTKTTVKGLKVTLRSPESGEGEALLATMREVIRNNPHLLTQIEEFTYTAEQENEMIQKYSDHLDQVIIVPEVEGKIVGMFDFRAGTKKRDAHTGEFGVSLLPQFQGQGIGTFVMETFLDWAKSNPRIEIVRLRVFAANTPAIALYRKLGFVEEGREVRGIKLGPSHYDDVVHMAFHIAESPLG
jgi:RimJ/RimL family protein N-acetyltransferase